MTELQRRTVILAGLGAGLVAARPAEAHHGWGTYDAANPLDLSGTVQRASFDNPHAALWLQTSDKTWEVVLAPPSRMRSRGVTEAMLASGAELEAHGYQSRNNPDELRAEWIRVAGTTYQLR